MIWVKSGSQWLRHVVSRRTLTRWVKDGKVESKIDDDRRLILAATVGHGETDQGHDDSGMSQDVSQQALVEQLRSEIERLEKQLEAKDKQIVNLQEELSEHSQRTDSIIMQLSGNQQMLLESTEQKNQRQKEPFWRRWLDRKQKNDDNMS